MTQKKEIGSWVIGYWTPHNFFENNVWTCFETRFKKILKVQKDHYTHLQKYHPAKNYFELRDHADFLIVNNPSQCYLKTLPDNSIDYIITDPPHGNRIPYLELSMLWNGWLKKTVAYEHEIIVSEAKERHKDIEHYNELLNAVIYECFRILRPNKHFSFMFNSLDDESWLKVKSIIRRGIIDEFLENNSISLTSRRLNEQFRELFSYLLSDVSQSHKWLNEYILSKNTALLNKTVGQIKRVDFFINEIPFDLKVTYLPVNFIEEQRKNAGLKPELTYLKQKARELLINFDSNDSNLYYSLTERLKDRDSEEATAALQEIKDFRIQLVNTIKTDHKILAKNLYERQSDFRFGAENRIFLILVDTDNFDDSWKLKRNIDLLQPKIHKYLDSFSQKALSDLELSFYKAGHYEVLTDVLVIEKG